MKKLLVLIVLVALIGLSGCHKQPDIIVVEVDKDFQDYDYAVGEVVNRTYSYVNKTYTYTIEIDGEIGEVESKDLFSLGEKVLVIEYEENKAILIDLS